MSEHLSSAARIARLRRLAARHDLGLQKSRCRSPHINDRGGYLLFDVGRNVVVYGDRYQLDLDDVADFLADLTLRPDAPTWGVSLPVSAA